MRVSLTKLPTPEDIPNWGYFFCDTNILRELIDNQDKWESLKNMLVEKQMLLVLSLIQLIELVKIPRYHTGLAELLLFVPSAFLKWWKAIIQDEIDAYPRHNDIPIIDLPPLNIVFRKPGERQLLQQQLVGEFTNKAHRAFESFKKHHIQSLAKLNTLSVKDLTDEQKDMHFRIQLAVDIGYDVRAIDPIVDEKLKQYKEFDPQNYFLGSTIKSAYMFYRYSLDSLSPEPSDVGDIQQVFYFPYCQQIVTEKDMAGVLSRIKKDRGLLGDTKITSIRFIREL